MQSLLHEEDDTWQKVLLRLEKSGVLLRLDQKILPTKFRYATVSSEEISRLRKVEHVIRKGRISSIDEEKIRFECGEEMELAEGTLIVDCARNSTKWPCDKLVFDGDIINLQFLMLPPPGLNPADCIFFSRSQKEIFRNEHKDHCWHGAEVPG